MTARTVHLAGTEDVVAWIAAAVTRTIADGNHPDHDLETVGAVMTSDAILDLIRDTYVSRCRRGLDRNESIRVICAKLIAFYCDRAGT